MKTIFQFVFLISFLWFAYQDNLLHFRVRIVTLVEHFLHLILGVLLYGFIKGCFLGLFADKKMAVISLLLIAGGSLDEFYFHRNIPLIEVEAHAKEHWSLFFFFVFSVILKSYVPF